jgi:TetR/AcrR family transcriptional repressor of nem operon
MKVSRERVAENRKNVLSVSSRLFRERGFENVTVAEIMAAAGLTHGAFYSYFSSKDDLITQSCEYVLAGEDRAETHSETLHDFAKDYLSDSHREDRAGGCLYAALAAEAARSSDATRDIITGKLQEGIARFAESAPGRTTRERRRAAIGSWAAMVGAVVLARAVNDDSLAKEITSLTLKWLEQEKALKA